MESPNRFYQQNSNFTKFKMAAATILKITLLAISQPFWHILAPNLIRRLTMGSYSQIYHQNSHTGWSKIQDGSGGHLEIR